MSEHEAEGPEPNCYDEVDRYDFENADYLFEHMYESSSSQDEKDSNSATIGNWIAVKDFDFKIDVNAIDTMCLVQARKEIPVVLERIMKQHNPDLKPESRLQFVRGLQEIDMFDVWMGIANNNTTLSQSFFVTMVNWIQMYARKLPETYKGDRTILNEDVLQFIEAELMISFYKCSPTQYFDKDFSELYPTAKKGISSEKYTLILQALSTSDHIEDDTVAGEWITPYNCDGKMAKVVEAFQKFCSSIAYIRHVTWACFDDDLMRKRSRSVAKFGYSQVNNPAKGMGVIHHAMVDVVTCLYMGGIVPSCGESMFDCVKIIQAVLCGVSIFAKIVLKSILFFWDQGYGGTEGKITTTTIAAGANIVTTCQRQKSFPFTFGQKPGPNRELIDEFGAPTCYWASKEVESLEGVKTQYALAYRNGLKRVVLMSTTLPECGPGRYTFVTKSHSFQAMKTAHIFMQPGDGEWARDDFEEDDFCCDYYKPRDQSLLDGESERDKQMINQIWSEFEGKNVLQLTSEQRCPEWFLLRQFRITGTCAYNLWKYAKTNKNENIQPFLKVIGIIPNVDNILAQPNSRIDDDESDASDYDSDASDEFDVPAKKPVSKPSRKSNLPPEYSFTILQIKAKLKDMCVSIRGLSSKKDFAEALIEANIVKRAERISSKNKRR
jgi:hypothetical protein